jgi:hypothetical protein
MLFSALYGMYTVMLHKLTNVLKASGQARQTQHRSQKQEKALHRGGSRDSTNEKYLCPTPDNQYEHRCPCHRVKINRGSSYRKIRLAAPSNIDVCSQPYPVTETNERRGQTKLQVL